MGARSFGDGSGNDVEERSTAAKLRELVERKRLEAEEFPDVDPALGACVPV